MTDIQRISHILEHIADIESCVGNLDKEGYALYDTLIKEYAMHKLIIVGSNDPAEYHFCKEQVNLMDYKEA